MTPSGPKKIKEMDRLLKSGGFSRAKTPYKALERGRSEREHRAKPKRSAKSQPLTIVKTPWKFPGLVQGFSTRAGGHSTVFGGHDLNLGFVKHDSRALVEKNRAALLKALNAGDMQLVNLKQVHSDRIEMLQSAPKSTLTADGMITRTPGLLLAIQVADCVPVLIVDPVKCAAGAFHAGWRGTVKRIVEKGVGMMQMHFDSDPREMHAAIGLCIRQCCYAVGEEVIDEFHSQFSYASELFRQIHDDDPLKTKYPLLFLTARAPGHGPIAMQTHLDLVEANRRQLIAAGVPAKNIFQTDLCTGCNTDQLFSHRKEDGFTGRQMGVVGWKDTRRR